MDARQAWRIFEQTGRVDAYMLYKRLENNRPDEEEAEPFDPVQDGWDRSEGDPRLGGG